MSNQLNPTRIVALCLCAFALIGVVAVGFAGDDTSGEEAAIDTTEYTARAEAPVEDEARHVIPEAGRVEGSSPDYASWVDEPAPEPEESVSGDSAGSSDNTVEETAGSDLVVPEDVPQ